MKLYILAILILIISCSTKQHKKEYNDTQVTQLLEKGKSDTLNSNAEIIETFIDSLNIGEKGKCKIEIIKHRVFDNTYVIIKFYTKGPAYWYIQNTYLYECDALMGLDPEISDFNNDKFNDITFISATAARGANEVRRLFIYDDREKKLISILNSQDFPNMQYNKELDCIDAFLVHGGSTTVFAKIVGDSLKQFARINNDNNRTVYEIDKFGKEKLIRKDTIIDLNNVYVRYTNYKPLKEYKKTTVNMIEKRRTHDEVRMEKNR
jgi:hypothetical protein